MRRLAEAADIHFFNEFINEEEFVAIAETVLYSVAGLVPDVESLPDEETTEYTRKIYQQWKKIGGKYDGRTFHAANWHFFKLRPQNFPTVRLAGGARLLNRMLKENLIENTCVLFKNGKLVVLKHFNTKQ